MTPRRRVTESNGNYEALVASTWRLGRTASLHGSRAPSPDRQLLRELVRYATLAANSHNSQPWRFRIENDRVTVLPDFSRRCPAADPDDHHLFASLGCATENVVLAAAAHGLRAGVSIDGGAEWAIRIDLAQGKPADSPLFRAIPERQSTRAEYDGKPVPSVQLAALESIASDDGVNVHILTGKRDLEAILDYVIAGNTAHMSNRAFVDELKDWLRFNESSALEHRDGLFAAASGQPTLPTWIGKIAFDFAFTPKRESDKYRRQIRSSAGAAIFVSEQDDPRSWIRAGRCCQRFALQATAFGLRHAFINQPVEVPGVRAQFAEYLGVDHGRPDLLVRFGYGPALPRSLRRPVEQVIV